MLHDFVEDSYKPVRMVLTGVGGVSHGQLISLSEKYFGDLSNDYQRKIPPAKGTRFTGSEVGCCSFGCEVGVSCFLQWMYYPEAQSEWSGQQVESITIPESASCEGV